MSDQQKREAVIRCAQEVIDYARAKERTKSYSGTAIIRHPAEEIISWAKKYPDMTNFWVSWIQSPIHSAIEQLKTVKGHEVAIRLLERLNQACENSKPSRLSHLWHGLTDDLRDSRIRDIANTITEDVHTNNGLITENDDLYESPTGENELFKWEWTFSDDEDGPKANLTFLDKRSGQSKSDVLVGDDGWEKLREILNKTIMAKNDNPEYDLLMSINQMYRAAHEFFSDWIGKQDWDVEGYDSDENVPGASKMRPVRNPHPG